MLLSSGSQFLPQVKASTSSVLTPRSLPSRHTSDQLQQQRTSRKLSRACRSKPFVQAALRSPSSSVESSPAPEVSSVHYVYSELNTIYTFAVVTVGSVVLPLLQTFFCI